MGKWHLSSLVRVLDFERKLFSRNLPLDLIRNGQMWYRQREKSDWTVSFGTKYIAFHNLVLCGRCICHCIGMCAYNAAAATKISSRYIYIYFFPLALHVHLFRTLFFHLSAFTQWMHNIFGCFLCVPNWVQLLLIFAFKTIESSKSPHKPIVMR